MSSTTKRKFVTKEIINEYVLPDASKELVRVTAGKGNNLHGVVDASGEEFLASMPCKFRKSVYIKRGDYVLIEKIPEGGKVKAEIVHIPLKDQIKYIRDQGLWPKAFEEEEEKISPEEEEENSDEEDDDDLFKNTNRRVIEYSSSSESSD
uniref:Probable RNA-binding protein EIF1AD n=1 Tax=Caligus rogercresseyi TaxID=217165 RepID=C1BQX9_CALRO|nr:Probable RNA-binding protein EIF1AD [Caligus rogercresseyi]|eukprot:TRINITY_DN4465_c0_g1_i2.p3 TRINITY_DN4465_c0_g1~~TRINITY_DN4465_c0_g1_i2.p3  ORF type:complete len:150 (+),score=69.68 TRINITY_DN4465_c0_g1_i2:63-512(+)